jgi:NhaP-type Na+/H+ or K+/H+ antiporter
MGKSKVKKESEPMPEAGRVVIGIVLFSFGCLALLTGKLYLNNWRGDTVFLPFVLLIGLLLIVVIGGLIFRLARKSKP